jgi:tRNA A37 N6-isopentenylltransferase MiaA
MEQIKIRTRRLAKQQRTWLKRFRAHPRAVWLPADGLSPPELAGRALAVIQQRFPGGPGKAESPG